MAPQVVRASINGKTAFVNSSRIRPEAKASKNIKEITKRCLIGFQVLTENFIFVLLSSLH
jgi:hypothetical protein